MSPRTAALVLPAEVLPMWVYHAALAAYSAKAQRDGVVTAAAVVNVLAGAGVLTRTKGICAVTEALVTDILMLDSPGVPRLPALLTGAAAAYSDVTQLPHLAGYIQRMPSSWPLAAWAGVSRKAMLDSRHAWHQRL